MEQVIIIATIIGSSVIGFLIGVARKKAYFFNKDASDFTATLEKAKSLRSEAMSLLNQDSSIELAILQLPETLHKERQETYVERQRKLETEVISLSKHIDQLTSTSVPSTFHEYRQATRTLEDDISGINWPLEYVKDFSDKLQQENERFSDASLLGTVSGVRDLLNDYQRTIQKKLDACDPVCADPVFKQFQENSLEFSQVEVDIRAELTNTTADRGLLAVRLENLRKSSTSMRRTHVLFNPYVELSYLLSDSHYRSSHYQPALWR
jgi:hypothetical protein